MDKQNSKDTEYRYRVDNQPHKQTGNIEARNNNADMDAGETTEPNVERANNAGIGDSGWNEAKLTNFTQNHSSDA